jgi:hypothetical protein
MLVKKVSLNPKCYFWKLEKTVDKQEKKFFKIFDEKAYCNDIYRIYVREVEAIEAEFLK